MVKTASSKASIKGQRALLNPDAEVKQVSRTKNNRGVVFFKNLPLGFFEPQLKRFLVQFGEISRIRISKSKKNGHSKGYGWVEFVFEDVAKVVADTMNGYIIGGKSLFANFVEKDKLHEETFRNAGRKFKHVPWKKIAIEQTAKSADLVTTTAVRNMLVSESNLQERLREAGIDNYVPLSVKGLFKKD